MLKKIACFAGALALIAGTAFAQVPADKGRVMRKELQADRRDLRPAERWEIAEGQRKLHRQEKGLRSEERELRRDRAERRAAARESK